MEICATRPFELDRTFERWRWIRTHRLLLLTVVMLSSAVSAHAQSPAHVGGAATIVTDSIGQVGSATWGGSLLFGVQVSPGLSIEFEPQFVGSFEGEYTSLPTPSSRARVVTRRRDTFLTFQLRARTGSLVEPVVGVSWVHANRSTHATFVGSGSTYFRGTQSTNELAVAGGIDVGVKLASHVFFVPTFRAFLRWSEPNSRDVMVRDTKGRFVVLRYGAGVRIPL